MRKSMLGLGLGLGMGLGVLLATVGTARAAEPGAEPGARELDPRSLKISPGGVGPLRAGVKAELGEVTRLLPGLEVEATSRRIGEKLTRVLLVSYVGQPVLEIIPGDKDSIAVVRAVSADVPSPAETLQVGSALDDVGRLDRCTLLGDKGADGTSCSVKGLDHLQFVFSTAEGSWSGTGQPAAAAFAGAKVTAIEWRP